jgi:cysteine desulfurase family protein (TIGR01976 family)
MLDVAALRSRFPAFERVVEGSPAAYLDAPAGTQVPRSVIDAVRETMERSVSNLGGPFAASEDSTGVVSAARSALADLVGGRPHEIAFGPNMTTLTFSFSRAVASSWEPGDRIVVTRLDHDANVAPWVRAAEERGVEVAFADIRTDDVTLDLNHLASLVDGRTRLVAVTACSNAFGSIVDTEAVSEIAHAVGARVFVDAVHAAPHLRLDTDRLGCDALVCSAYKFFGPHVGVLWGRREWLKEIDAVKVRPAPANPPGKFETGTPSFPLLAGATAAVEHLASLGDGEERSDRLDDAYRRIAAYERGLADRFLAGLPGTVRLRGIDSSEGRVSTFALEVPGRRPADVAAELGAAGIFVWAGHHYAIEPMRRLGLDDGVLRIGFVHTTTADEVDRVLDALASC